MNMRKVCFLVVICVVPMLTAARDLSSCYTKKATWAESMVSARLSYRVWQESSQNPDVAEWTRSRMAPYPYVESDGRNVLDDRAKRVVRGGSWRDRPMRSTSSFRVSYEPYQKVYNVGFRIIIEASDKAAVRVAVR